MKKKSITKTEEIHLVPEFAARAKSSIWENNFTSTSLKHFAPAKHTLSEQAVTVLRAMRGRLHGCLERDTSFLLDRSCTDVVPRHVANELHDAGFIEIDETAPIGDTYVFRISTAGMAYLDANPGS